MNLVGVFSSYCIPLYKNLQKINKKWLFLFLGFNKDFRQLIQCLLLFCQLVGISYVLYILKNFIFRFHLDQMAFSFSDDAFLHLTSSYALITSIFLALGFVGSLYIWPNPLNLSRNNPQVNISKFLVRIY